MQWRSSIVALALALVGTTAATAQALDLCFQYPSGGAPTVAKRLKVPGKNKCVPFNGAEMGGGYGAMSGTVCTRSDGASMVLQYTYSDYRFQNTSYVEIATCRFGLPIPPGAAVAGACAGTAIPSPGNNTAFADTANVWLCNGNVP